MARDLFEDSQPKDLFAQDSAPSDQRKKDLLAEAQRRGLQIPGQEDTPGILDYLMMIGEPAMTFASGAIAEPVAGIAGLAKTITSGADAGAETIDQARTAMTYQPRSEAGQRGMQAVGETLGPIIEPISKAVQAVGDTAYKAGGPVAGAGAITLLAAIPEIIGLKGTRAAKGMAIRKVVQNAKDLTSIFDEAGALRPEIKQSLAAAGIPEDEFISSLPKDAAGQAERAQRAASSGVQLTRGELGQDFTQRATELRLLESTMDTAAEPLRQFKLKQSDAIKSHLEKSMGPAVTAEETGQLIIDSLSGRKSLLRSQKNDLYRSAAENAKDLGFENIPVMVSNISDVIPDEKKLRGLRRASKGTVDDVLDTLAEYGIVEPTEMMLKKEIQPAVLTIDNYDDLDQTLNMLQRSDPSGATALIVKPIREALAREVDELGAVLTDQGLSQKVVTPIKQARALVRQIKTEFSPQAITGRLINVKPDGVTPIIEASKIYDKIAARSAPVEETRRIVNSLKAAPKGEEALASLQASVLMDLIDAGFSTESRQISGVKVFNPIAFKKRLKNLGQDKVDAIFTNNREAFRNIRNIEKIATDLIPPAGAMPKGSASVILDLANKLGLVGISAKIPGGALVVGAMQKIAQPVKVGREVKKAIMAEPDVVQLQSLASTHYPGLAAAYATSAALEANEDQSQ